VGYTVEHGCNQVQQQRCVPVRLPRRLVPEVPTPGHITGQVDDRLKEIIEEVCQERDAEIIELETVPDHVHLLVGVDPQYGIHRLVKQIKGRSSRLLRQEFQSLRSRLPTLWTNSYFVATVAALHWR
jgi:REP element-mobilizing transposase RayT